MELIRSRILEFAQTNILVAVLVQLLLIGVFYLIISRIGILLINKLFKSSRLKAKQTQDAERIEQVDTINKAVRRIWQYATLLMMVPVGITLFIYTFNSVSSVQDILVAVPLLNSMFQVALVLIMSYLALKLGSIGNKKIFDSQRRVFANSQNNKRSLVVREAKLTTLETLTQSILRYIIYFIALLSILSAFGVPTASIITGAGVLGVALGFGAQNLVRDVLAGVFILFEDQFDVGDLISAGGIQGYVTNIALRSTRLKDFDGSLHFVPNGELSIVTNLSRTDRRALVDIGVDYGEDLAYVEQVLTQLCSEIASENEWITDGPTVLGVQELGNSSVSFRIIAFTLPGEQWKAERVLRARIKNRFDEVGITIPYPHQVLIMEKDEENHD